MKSQEEAIAEIKMNYAFQEASFMVQIMNPQKYMSLAKGTYNSELSYKKVFSSLFASFFEEVYNALGSYEQFFTI